MALFVLGGLLSMVRSRLIGPVDLVLDISAGPDSGRRLWFRAPGTYVLGRLGDADENLGHLTDALVSRRHLEFVLGDGEPRVRLLATGNPITVGGALVTEAPLTEGETITLGDTCLRVGFQPTTDAERKAALPRRRRDAFEVEGEIGRGAMGCVYLAVDKASGARVALKCFEPDPAVLGLGGGASGGRERAIAYFRRELDLAARLHHPKIVRALGVGRAVEELFLVMELVEGGSLHEHAAAFGPLSAPDAVSVGEDVLEALAYAHGQRVIHRDVCPNNVLVEVLDDGSLSARLVDFGIGKLTGAAAVTELTRTGEARGKLDYMAPERFSDAKHATVASDLFGTAAMLYYALTRTTWHGQQGNSWWQRAVRGEIRCVPLQSVRAELPAALVAVIERSLAPVPGDRFQSADEMRRALRGALTEKE